MSSLDYATDTIDVLINLLSNTKEKLEAKDVLADNLYQTFDILNLIYVSIQDLYGTDALTSFQEEYTSLVIRTLQEKIRTEYIILSTVIEDGYYLIKMSISIHGQVQDVCYINPYFKSISFIPSETTTSLQTKIDELTKVHDQISDRIEELRLSKQNPLYYAKDDTVLLAKMTVQKKKYERLIAEEMRDKEAELLSLKNEIASYHAELISEQNAETEVIYYRDEYLKRLRRYFGFLIVKDEVLEETSENTYDQEEMRD